LFIKIFKGINNFKKIDFPLNKENKEYIKLFGENDLSKYK